MAVILLRKIGPDAREAIRPIILGLKEPGNEADWHVEATRVQIVEFLGQFDREAEQAIAALTAALRDENERVRHAAADALKKIRGEISR